MPLIAGRPGLQLLRYCVRYCCAGAPAPPRFIIPSIYFQPLARPIIRPCSAGNGRQQPGAAPGSRQASPPRGSTIAVGPATTAVGPPGRRYGHFGPLALPLQHQKIGTPTIGHHAIPPALIRRCVYRHQYSFHRQHSVNSIRSILPDQTASPADIC